MKAALPPAAPGPAVFLLFEDVVAQICCSYLLSAHFILLFGVAEIRLYHDNCCNIPVTLIAVSFLHFGIRFPMRGLRRVELNFGGRIRRAPPELCGRLPGLLQAECAAG